MSRITVLGIAFRVGARRGHVLIDAAAQTFDPVDREGAAHDGSAVVTESIDRFEVQRHAIHSLLVRSLA